MVGPSWLLYQEIFDQDILDWALSEIFLKEAMSLFVSAASSLTVLFESYPKSDSPTVVTAESFLRRYFIVTICKVPCIEDSDTIF